MKPILKWVGGKTQILDALFEYFPTNLNSYHEIFLGGGSVLLYLLEKMKAGHITVSGDIYVYDKNKELIQMFVNIKNNHRELEQELNLLLNTYKNCEEDKGNRKPNSLEEAVASKESYYYWLRNRFNNMSDDEKISIKGSALFIFLNKTCFRGLYRIGPNGLNVPFGNYYNLISIITTEELSNMSQAIQNVNFMVMDYAEAMTRPTPGDFVYLDPPYVPEKKTSFVNYQSGGFKDDEHDRLFEKCHDLRERNVNFVISNSNTEKVLNAFSNYSINRIDCRRAINPKKPGSITQELIISRTN